MCVTECITLMVYNITVWVLVKEILRGMGYMFLYLKMGFYSACLDALDCDKSCLRKQEGVSWPFSAVCPQSMKTCTRES